MVNTKSSIFYIIFIIQLCYIEHNPVSKQQLPYVIFFS